MRHWLRVPRPRWTARASTAPSATSLLRGAGSARGVSRGAGSARGVSRGGGAELPLLPWLGGFNIAFRDGPYDWDALRAFAEEVMPAFGAKKRR